MRIPELEELIPIIERAAGAVLALSKNSKILRSGEFPLTEADIASHEVLVDGLAQFEIPILSEENTRDADAASRYLWVVDPLDGTSDYADRRPEWAVMVALLEKETPILGIVCAPALGVTYTAQKGAGAFAIRGGARTKIHVRPPSDPLTLLVSVRHHTKLMTDVALKLGAEEVKMGSAGVKICRIAEGKADLMLTGGKLGEWDVAAPQCILEEAGGIVSDLNGAPLQYRNPEWRIPNGLLAGSQAAHERARDALSRIA